MTRAIEAWAAAASAALLSAGCGPAGPGAPPVVRLAAGFRPAAIEPVVWSAGGERELVIRTVAADGAGVHAEVHASLAPGDWQRTGDTWSTPPHELFSSEQPPGSLRIAGEELALADKQIEPGTFALRNGRLRLRTADGRRPAAGSYTARLSFGREENGAWRLRMGPFVGDAIPAVPGFAQELVVDVPARAALRFATCARRPPTQRDPAPLSFRVRLDGELLFEHGQVEGVRWHEVALPPEGRSGARLAFEVDGPPTLAAFFAPVVGPADPARVRETVERRPDVVLFMADTFRADNLELYGGPPGIAPEVDRFAEQSLRFARAWSPASWTLPAHASMFTGLFPPQHAAMSDADALTRAAHTLAEQLAAHGYRTGGITDGGNVSQQRGLDQGFEWWDQRQPTSRPEALEPLRERVAAFLEADDGRPLFLFVQSYRAHSPYGACAATRAELAPLIGDPRDYGALDEEMDRRSWGPSRRVPERALPAVEEAGRLYRGGSRDLSRGFDALLADLEGRGLGDAFVVFTSDHGEAFAEHGLFGHGGDLHEAVIRVPLLVRGPGIEPADVEASATLVDLPRTLCELAAVPPADEWLGRSLLALDPSGQDRPVSAFARAGDTYERATVEGGRKLILAREGEGPLTLREVYDLAADPWEAANLRGGRDDLEALEERALRHLAPLEIPLLGAEAVQLDDAARAELEALGYL